MKFLFFFILSLGVFSCNIPKNNAPKADTEYQTKSSSSSNMNKDSLHIELKQCRFSQGDSIVILYSICIVLRIKHSGIIYIFQMSIG